MNEHQRHKHLISLGQRDPLLGEQQYATDFFQKNSFSPKKRNTQNEPLKKDHISKQINDEISKLSNEQLATFNAASDDRKFKSLIIDAISSADRAIKAILPYGHSEIQKYCSVYFLNKEKLLSFIDANNRSFFSNSDRNSKKGEKRKLKKKENGSSDLTQMVPINHLERLEKIVYNKIIPILQNEFETQKRKSQKNIKKGKDWGNSDLRQGLQLLERLNDKQRIAVDECAQILQKFIVRIMQKQQKMLNKIGRMQERLDQQIKKTQILSEESKKWEQYRAKTEKQWNRQKRNLFRYEEFSKQIKAMFTQKDKVDSQASEKECLQDILQQIRRTLNNQERHSKRQKKCDHKPHKEAHASCKQEATKSEQQIKSLKQVVKSLDNQICVLREQCQNMDNRLQQSNEKVSKFESKSKKIIEQNQSMNRKVDEMMKEDSYKSKLIQQYLRMISKLQDTLRLSEQNLIKLNQQNDSYLELIAKHSSQKEDYIKQMMETDERSKEMQQVISKKQIQIQELVNSLYAKEREIIDNQTTIKKLYKQIEELYRLIKERQENLSASVKEIQKLQNQILLIKQTKAIKQPSKRDHETSFELNRLQNNEKEQIMNIDTLQSIENASSPIKNNHIHNVGQQIASLQQVQKFQDIQKLIIVVYDVDDHSPANLKGPQRDDFIPRQVNMQTLADVLTQAQKNQSVKAVHEINDINTQQNKKGVDRDDFIPAQFNKQFEDKGELEQYLSHTLKDQLQPMKEASNIQVNSNSKSKNQDQEYIKVEDTPVPQTNHEELQGKFKNCRQKISEQLYVLEAESHKIQQLLDLNTRIGDHFTKLKSKIDQKEQYQTDMLQIKDEMQALTMMLTMCKRSTIKKLQKIAKTQILHQEAQQEIERLKHRLDDALIVDQPLSNIQQNSDGSGFTIPDHLQSFFKNNVMEPTKFNQQYFISRVPIKPKPSKDFFTQTDAQVQTINPPNAIAIESEVIVQNSSPIISLVEDRQKDMDRSFINELADISPVLPHPALRLESLQNSDEYKDEIIPKSLKEKPTEKDVNPQIPEANARATSQMKQISSLIDYHKEQIVSLHKRLRQNAEQVIDNQKDIEQILQTPQKNPLANSAYVRNIMKAPEKQKMQVFSNDKSQVEFRHQTEIEQMKEMFTQREQHFSELVVERQQEIERLKSIIKTLTKAQEVEEKVSPKASRNKEPISREIQNLKNQNEQLWMFLEKEKSEIQRLQILIRQYQLHQQLHKLKSSHHHHEHQHTDVHSDPAIHQLPIDQNQGFVYTMTPAKRTGSDRAQIAGFEAKNESKSENLQQKQQQDSNELMMDTQKKGKEKDEGLSAPKHLDSPTKRFARKSQKFEKQESPRERRHTSPKLTMQFGWQELVPQYFGEKSKHGEK